MVFSIDIVQHILYIASTFFPIVHILLSHPSRVALASFGSLPLILFSFFYFQSHLEGLDLMFLSATSH